ncbi:hypothetical protein CQ018_05890 [Arthrobacter sp. MYb227]|uniref:plasmid pRiA4b ORF-3 family protein n=1 Tax=Arthrobacter sp. MYb227 TaxID=1848601 RepID=UPI000CFDF27E|nr:plasmid pRiA4b ORF-3 family protein [Arthrobacter sp. MYb227]PQZ94870.1 hypothetical protein CQ018_05890 [Arthrobacter sp. MYb227]
MKNLRTWYTLKVKLYGSEPLIWRRLEVDGAMSLERFHIVLQAALGWTNSHLHAFSSDNPFERGLGAARANTLTWLDAGSIAEGLEGQDELDTSIADACEQSGGMLWYQYDFGDSWMHTITVESTRIPESGEPIARILDGAMRIPLENSGGLHGWYEMLELDCGKSGAEGREYLLEWLHSHAGYFTSIDPLQFDVGAANLQLRLYMGGAQPDKSREDEQTLNPATFGNAAVGTWIATVNIHAGLVLSNALYQLGINVLDTPSEPSMPADAPRAMASILWWIRACEGTGLPLTAAGYLSPAIIPEVIEGIGWEHEDFVQFGAKTEVHLHTLHDFRLMLIEISLLKVQGKRLVATPTAVRLAGDPAKLWAHLAKRALNSKRERDIYDATMVALIAAAGEGEADQKTITARINEGMRLLGYLNYEGGPIGDTDFQRLGDRYNAITKAFRMSLLDNGNRGRAVEIEREFARAVLSS